MLVGMKRGVATVRWCLCTKNVEESREALEDERTPIWCQRSDSSPMDEDRNDT